MEPDASEGGHAPKRKGAVGTVTIDSRAVLLDGSTGRLQLLDPIATAVWSALDGVTTVDELTGDLAAVFAVDRERVRDDVHRLLRELHQLGLLEGAPSQWEVRREAMSVDPTSRLARRSLPPAGEPRFVGEPPSS